MPKFRYLPVLLLLLVPLLPAPAQEGPQIQSEKRQAQQDTPKAL